jgi:hypothetical protein
MKDMIDSVLDPKGTELKKLVAAGKFEAAAQLWVDNEAEFAKSEKLAPFKPTIGKGLGELLGASVPGTLVTLDALATTPAPLQTTASRAAHWTNSPDQWPEIRAKLVAADALLVGARSHAFFIRVPTLAPAWVSTLAASNAQARERLMEGAVRAFVAYDHLSATPFFEAFPVPVADRMKSALAVRAAAVWTTAVLRGSEAQARALVRTYVPHIKSPEARLLIGGAYAGVVARERNWHGPRSLQQIVQLIQTMDDAGLDPAPAARGVKIGLVRGLNPQVDALPWKLTDTALSAIAVEPVPHTALSAWAREVAAVKPNQVYVLIDLARLSVSWRAGDISERRAERQVGQREEPNPDWDSARSEVNAARKELIEVEELDRQAQAQAQQLAAQSRGSSAHAMSAVFASAASAAALSSARGRVARAELSFTNTPRTVTKPVKQNYQTALARFEVVQTRDVGVYIVDGSRGVFGKVELRDTARVQENVEFGVDPRDASFSTVTARNTAARAQLKRFAEKEMAVDPTGIWRRLLAAPPPALTRPVGELTRALKDDHMQWAATVTAERAGIQSGAQRSEERILRIVQAQQ